MANVDEERGSLRLRRKFHLQKYYLCCFGTKPHVVTQIKKKKKTDGPVIKLEAENI